MSELQALAHRIARLEDAEAIRRLKYRYFRASDAKDVETFRDCFVEGEIALDYGRIGCFKNRDDLSAVFSRLACAEHIVEIHHAQNPEIDVLDEHNARGTWGLYYQLIDTHSKSITQLGGQYRDEYRKTERGWRISASEFHVYSTQILDFSSGDTLRPLFAGRTAPQAIDDPEKQALPKEEPA